MIPGTATSAAADPGRNLGTVMQALPQWGQSLGLSAAPEVWAPDVHLINGKFFAYYSISAWGDVTHSAIGLMTATALDPSSPNYGWRDLGLVVGSPRELVGELPSRRIS